MLARSYDGRALSRGGCRSARCRDGVVARNRSDDDYVYRAFSGPLREVGASLVAPPPQPDRLIDGYLSALDDAAREGPIARRRCLDRRRGRGRVGAGPSRPRGRRAGRTAGLGRRPRSRTCGAGGTAFGVPAARRRFGGNDDADAGVQPAVVGRRADPVVARPVAAIARRHGGSGGLRRAELRRADPAGRAAGRWPPRSTTRFTRCRWRSTGSPPRPRAALRTVTLDQIGADPAALGAACLAALGD